MAKTLTGTYNGPVQVQFGTNNNPLSITGTIEISDYNLTALALQPGPGTNWTVNNSGRIVGHGPAFGGVVFGSNYSAVSSGTLTNRAGGYIYGGTAGVAVYGANGAITNLAGATIAGFGYAIKGSGALTVTNYGRVGGNQGGIWGLQGGAVTNSGTLTAGLIAVKLSGTNGSVTNLAGGTIIGLTGVALGGSFTNQAGGLISASSGVGVGLSSGTGMNAGVITASTGIGLTVNGASFTNQSGGLISGRFFGATIGSASLVNQANATIEATYNGAPLYNGNGAGVLVNGTGGITNSGLIQIATGIGVNLGSGVLTNTSSGTITGRTGVSVRVGGTVVNAGTISGFGPNGAVFFRTASSSNHVAMLPGAVFNGLVDVGTGVLELGSGSGTGTLTSLSSSFTRFSSVYIDSGATWQLNSSSIDSGNTLTDAGTISGGVTLSGSGLLSVAASGSIGSGGLFTVIGTSGTPTVNNAGRILAGASHLGVYLDSGGSVTNAAGGTITGFPIRFRTGAGTVMNSGSILADGGVAADGIEARAGGTITNAAGGTIGGQRYGINLAAGGTVTNSGTISGTNGAAYFGGTGSNLLALYPGAVVSGAIRGSTSASNRLELASGAGTGALSSSLTGFSRIDVDSGATWQLVSSSIASGMTLNDAGSIIGSGVTLGGGGQLSIAAGGTVSSTIASVVVGASGAPTVVNAGRILPVPGGTGVYLSGGAVTNVSGGFITGFPIRFHIGAGTAVNSGTIVGYGGPGLSADGILMAAGGSVTNTAGGTISGQRFGVALFSGGTVTNAGTIGGTSGAISFGGTANGRLIINPGAVFSGAVSFSAAAYAALELGGTSSGSLSDLGSNFTGFDVLQIDSGAHWTLSGSNTLAAGQSMTNAGALTLLNTSLNDPTILLNNGAITLDPSTLTVAGLTGTGSVTIDDSSELEVGGTVAAGETIDLSGANATLVLDTPTAMAGSVVNFGDGDLIHLKGVDPTSVSFSGGQLHFGSGNAFAVSLANGGPVHAVTDGSGGANVSLLCFCAGTRIATPSGEVPVQRLAVGDRVLTAQGVTRPIVWIGHGKGQTRRGRRTAATPVIVRKNALAPNVPNRDLRVTKGHSLFIDGVLIPVEELINHRSILWDDHAVGVAIYHIELETHDVLIANGAPAESYRDDGNRWLFGNANSGWSLPPQEPCAPLLKTGPVIDAIWHRLLDRAGPRPGMPLTDDPDLHLMVDGHRLDPISRTEAAYAFRLPAASHNLRIKSRAAIPAEHGLARDQRMLGVALRRILLHHSGTLHSVAGHDPCLADGFHAFEPDCGIRWTDGNALLPTELLGDDPIELVLEVPMASRYPIEQVSRSTHQMASALW